MRVITAPEIYIPKDGDITCFLAGGITGCRKWQDEVIENIRAVYSEEETEHLVLFNPRRDHFPMNADREQIEWEYRYLMMCDIFSIYFCGGGAMQTISMYELGRYVALKSMPMHYLLTWIPTRDQIIIDVEDGYPRKKDVIIQVELATNLPDLVRTEYVCPNYHAFRIVEAYRNWMRRRKEIEG